MNSTTILRRLSPGQPMEEFMHGQWVPVETSNVLNGDELAFPPTLSYWDVKQKAYVFVRDLKGDEYNWKAI